MLIYTSCQCLLFEKCFLLFLSLNQCFLFQLFIDLNKIIPQRVPFFLVLIFALLVKQVVKVFGFGSNSVHVLTLRIQFLNFFLSSNFLDYFFILHGALHQNLRFSIHINLWRSYYLIIFSFVLANFNILIFEFRVLFNYLNTAHDPLSINTRVNRTIYGH